jgi:hypothetical protein
LHKLIETKIVNEHFKRQKNVDEHFKRQRLLIKTFVMK